MKRFLCNLRCHGQIPAYILLIKANYPLTKAKYPLFFKSVGIPTKSRYTDAGGQPVNDKKVVIFRFYTERAVEKGPSKAEKSAKPKWGVFLRHPVDIFNHI